MGLLNKFKRNKQVETEELYDDELYDEDEYYEDDGEYYEDDVDEEGYYEDDGVAYYDDYLDEDDYYDEDDNFDEERYRKDQGKLMGDGYEQQEDGGFARVRKGASKKSKMDEETDVRNYFKQGLSLDEIEAIEYRKSKRESLKVQAQKEAQDKIDFLDSFSRPSTVFGFMLFYIVSVAYLNFLTGQMAYSILVSIVGAYLLTKWYLFKEHQIEVKESDLKALEALASDISFEAQAGKNVYNTFSTIIEKDNYDGRVEADIKYTYNILNQETELDLTNFETYNFTPFNLFLRNVSIWYTEGVPVKELFDKSIANINFELVKRDELRSMHKKQLIQELITVAITLVMPAVTRLASPDQYLVAMGKPVALTILISIFYFAQIYIITSVKKKSLDIDIR